MRYRLLPIEWEWRDLTPEAIEAARGPLLVETMSTRGFQIVTGVLRNLERATMEALRAGSYGQRVDLGTGRLQCIEEIRRSLVGILPVPQRPAVNWYDDEHEGFTRDDAAPDDDHG